MTFPPVHNWKLLAIMLSILAPVWGTVPFGLVPSTPSTPSSPAPVVTTATPSATAPTSPSAAARPTTTTTAAAPLPTTPGRPTTPGPTTPGPNTPGPATRGSGAQVIVRFTSDDPAVRLQVLREAAASAGLAHPHIVRELATGAHLVGADGDAAAFLTALRAHPGVVAATPNSTVTRAATANDPRFASQWALRPGGGGAGFSTAWDRTLGAGSRVAVIDTGKTNHPDLAGQWLGGHDFISDADYAGDGNGRDADASDTGDFCGSAISSWHGTHVAGIVAANRNNSVGIAGAAPSAKVVPVRVLGRCGGEMADLIDAIVWSAGGTVPGMAANPHPARVINMSLSSLESCPRELQTSLSMARRLGAVAVAAAGNFNESASLYTPGNSSGELTVAASTTTRGLADYSNSGAGVNLAAPGGAGSSSAAILSTWLSATATNTGGYTYLAMSGTSMAAPHVAGAAALLLALKPNLTVGQVEAILTGTAASSAGCSGCGSGILDAAAAIAQVPVLASASLSAGQLTLRGSGFTLATHVWLGTRTLAHTRSGDGTITATLPADLPAGTYAVTVFTGDVSSGSRVLVVS